MLKTVVDVNEPKKLIGLEMKCTNKLDKFITN